MARLKVIIRGISIALAVVAVLAGVAFGSAYFFKSMRGDKPQNPTQQIDRQADLKVPELETTVILDGLKNPWDLAFIPNTKNFIFSQRAGTISYYDADTKAVRQVAAPSDVVARGEGGMMGLAVDRNFAGNRYVYSCFNSSRGSDIRVVRWRMSDDFSTLQDRKDIVTGMPANPSGRHSGCQVEIGADQQIWVGTGDAANANTPQDPQSLGGKILRVNNEGEAVGGPFAPGLDPRVYSFGHRNTQGLAMYAFAAQTDQGESYGLSVEHGSSRDDEVNELVKGNFGWAPGPGYNESVPMTDLTRFKDAKAARWSSGSSTIATGGATLLQGNQWGAWEDQLAVGVLKDKHLRIMVNDGSKITQTEVLKGQFGRIRAAVMTPTNGQLYITTDNGSGDRIIRVTPKQ